MSFAVGLWDCTVGVVVSAGISFHYSELVLAFNHVELSLRLRLGLVSELASRHKFELPTTFSSSPLVNAKRLPDSLSWECPDSHDDCQLTSYRLCLYHDMQG